MTEHNPLAEALQQANPPREFLASVIQASTEYSIIVKDLEGRIEFWNEGAKRLYGYSFADVIGKSSNILHAPEDIALGLPRKMRDTALETGRWEGVISRITKDRLRITARVVVTPRRDADGNPLGFLLISKDVTQEFHLRERIQRTRLLDLDAFGTSAEDILEFLTTLLEASTEYSIIGLDLTGRIVLWNEGARRIYGYEPWEVVGSKNVSFLHRDADQRAGLPQRILDAAMKEKFWSGEIFRVAKNGKIFPARVVVTPRVDAERRLRGFLLISHPVEPAAISS